MATSARRFLITSVLLLTALGTILGIGAFAPGAPAAVRPGQYVYTLDRGGLIRFNNGKTDVETPFQFKIRADPLQVPRFLGSWEGIDFPLNLIAYTSLNPELIINRRYRSGNDWLTFTVVGSDTTRKLHRPEVCYRAANWGVTDLPPRTIPLEQGSITVNQFITRDDLNEDRLILYWYLWQDGRRRIEDGAYVMHISVSLNNRTPDQAAELAGGFLREIFPRQIDRGPSLPSLPV